MADSAGLAGCAILIARPAHQCEALVALIRAAGGEAVVFPTLEIEPIELSDAARHALGRLREFDLAVFVSANAVQAALPYLSRAGGWPGGPAVAAIGQATARALRAAGIDPGLVPPAAGDSEALLSMPALQRLQIGKVLIFRGAGGRELLADALRARGAQIEYVECYRRVLAATDPAPVRARLHEHRLHGVVAASAEALRNLLELIGAAQRGSLLDLPLFVQHERVAHAAHALGFSRVSIMPLEDAATAAAIARALSGV
jgi:uroporphyrinogen-III synthase